MNLALIGVPCRIIKNRSWHGFEIGEIVIPDRDPLEPSYYSSPCHKIPGRKWYYREDEIVPIEARTDYENII